MPNWVRIKNGDLKTHELRALRAVAETQPVIPCRVPNIREYDGSPVLRDLAVAELIEMRSLDGERSNPHDIPFAIQGGWLGVVLRLTDAGSEQLVRSRHATTR